MKEKTNNPCSRGLHNSAVIVESDRNGSNHKCLPEEAAAKAATKAATKALGKGRCEEGVGIGTVHLGREESGPAHLREVPASEERQLRNSNRCRH